MRQMSAEEIRTEQLVNKLKERISQIGRWHSKRRKADTTRIWKKLFADLEILVKDEKNPFTNRAYIMLIVYPHQKRYTMHFHRHNSVLYHSVVGKREPDYNKVIKELNALLIRYNLVLLETPESQKRKLNRSLNCYKEYELKFAKYN